MFKYREVLARLRAGETVRAIARSGLVGRDKATVVREVARAQGWLKMDQPLPEETDIARVLGQHKPSASTISNAEPWRKLVTEWLEQGVSGTAIHGALCRNHGFTGSYSSVARLSQSIRGAQRPEPTVRLHFDPGDAVQVDFGAGPMMMDADGVERRTWAFVMTLCFSRHQYVEFVWDQSVPTWLGCHRRAFEWFNGVPRRVIIDNAKCAITKACANDPLVQRAYGECALGYGFKIDPCPPYDPQKKGIVEAGVKYVKRNFLPLRQFRHLTDLNEQVRHWVMNDAGQRNHGTTRQRPLALFALERDSLNSLPLIAPDLGKRLWLRATDCSVALYHAHQHIHTHPRPKRRGERVTVRDHLPPNAAAFLTHDRQYCLEQAKRVGPACQRLASQLLDDRILEKLRTVQNILRLGRTYGPQRLDAACARALAHDSLYYRTVKSILAGNFDRLPVTELTDEPYASKARFARDADDLFTEQPGRLH
ncbi:unnamed protein product [Chondrus crispus]|uniref:Integrase catalytic domain-containing protein n=1 Tax=Chondrus crispus TaxID=2769 RepID=R7Q9K1_CHOCR|nr:unnamed protein product [Chondrus crispus]CDF34458.1 unnamed protein product [Chondrus crispus]|eukprot:XP_005714277.1 unnamed protein product [Chondrus crispus]